MKKIFLLFIAGAAMLSASAQQVSKSVKVIPSVTSGNVPSLYMKSSDFSARTTTTVYDYDEVMENVVSSNPYIYSYAGDTGMLIGTNVYGFNQFAERYDFNSADSQVSVIGVVALFGGTVAPASTHYIQYYAWNVASPTVASSTLTFSGFPGTVIDSTYTISYDSLGIYKSVSGTDSDTYVARYFNDSSSFLSTSFFVGYTSSYNWAAMGGDTIGLFCDTIGSRNSAVYTVSGGDTTVNDQNVTNIPGYTGGSGTSFFDYGWDLGFPTNFFLFPIITAQYSSTLGVKGITNRNFTFYGNYPNPAISSTNIKFSLAVNSDVTITIADMNGRTINTIKESNLPVGENIIPVETSDLVAGNYLYVINVKAGGGIASKFTVIK